MIENIFLFRKIIKFIAETFENMWRLLFETAKVKFISNRIRALIVMCNVAGVYVVIND